MSPRQVRANPKIYTYHTADYEFPRNRQSVSRWMLSLFSFSGLRLFLIGWILTAITNFPSGFSHTSINTAVAQMNSYLNESFSNRYGELDYHEISLIKSGINSVWYAGQIFGAAISPFICDHYGRKGLANGIKSIFSVAYIISVVLMTSACGLQMAASFTSFAEILIIGRIITAIFSPLSDAALILYLQEISPSSLRGTMSSLYTTGYATMCLFGMILGNENILGHSLPILLFVPIIPGIISLFFILWAPETPKFLIIARQDREAALRSLNFYQGREADENQLIAEENTTKIKQGNTFHHLGEKHLLKALALSVAVLVLTLPFYPVLQSSTFFFLQLGVSRHVWQKLLIISSQTSQLTSSLLMVLLVFSCIISTLIVDKLPRRVLLLSMGTTCILSLWCFAILAHFGYTFLALSSIFSFIFSYGLGVGPIVWFICPELVELKHRSVMFCLCYAVHSCLVVITNFAAIPLFVQVGALSFIPIFIVPMTVALVVVALYLPETKGKETTEIVKILRGRVISPN